MKDSTLSFKNQTFFVGIDDQSLRSLCRLRHYLVKDMVRIKNRIKGHLNMHGITIGENSYSNWSAVYIKKLEKACNCIPGGGYTLKILINNLKTLKTQNLSASFRLCMKVRKPKRQDALLRVDIPVKTYADRGSLDSNS